MLFAIPSIARDLFYADFEDGLDAKYATGSPKSINGNATRITPGKNSNGAIRANQGGVAYDATNNFSWETGTIAFDFAPSWDGNDDQSHVIFAVYTDSKDTYLQLNKAGSNNKFLKNQLGGSFVVNGTYFPIQAPSGRRLSVEKWRKSEWHRIVLAFDENTYYLNVDGKNLFKGPRGPQPTETCRNRMIVIGESGGDAFDNLTISDDCKLNFVAYGEILPDQDILYIADAPEWKADRPGALGKNAFPRQPEPLPIIFDGKQYAKGLAMHATNSATYRLMGQYETFQATIGISDYAGLRGSVLFRILADGKERFRHLQTRTAKPTPIAIDIANVKELTLECLEGVDDFCDHSAWADACLLKSGIKPPQPSIVKTIPKDYIQPETAPRSQQQLDEELDNAYRYAYEDLTLRENHSLLFAPTNVTDSFDPASNAGFAPSGILQGFAAPDEIETLATIVATPKDTPTIDIRLLAPLKSENNDVIAEDNLKILYGMRMPECIRYDMDHEKTRMVTKFLRKITSFVLKAGHFREIFLKINVPPDQPPGIYRSTLGFVETDGKLLAQLPISFHVLPIKLSKPIGKIFGIYYNLARTLNHPEAFQAEMNDLITNNITMIHCADFLKPDFIQDQNGQYIPDFTAMVNGLKHIEKVGFKGYVVVSTELGEMIGCFYPFIKDDPSRKKAALDAVQNQAYLKLAIQVINGLKDVQRHFANLVLIPTTMDEVFNHGRLPIYIAAVKAANQVPGFKHYITFHFQGENANKMRAELAPHVHWRCHHMSSWEWFLGAGNTKEDYKRELDQFESVAGAYYNPVGAFYAPNWYRVRNGLLLMESPLDFMMPWTYYSCLQYPFSFPENAGAHIFGFYSHQDKQLVSAKIWEGYREGIDDLRYLQTLKHEIQSADPENNIAKQAQVFLDDLLAAMPSPYALPHGPKLRGTHLECPWTATVAAQLNPLKLNEIRLRCADFIRQLQLKP